MAHILNHVEGSQREGNDTMTSRNDVALRSRKGVGEK